ncbi:MAG: transglycosylase SLT domain-containing protein [Hyphomicrobium sp.]
MARNVRYPLAGEPPEEPARVKRSSCILLILIMIALTRGAMATTVWDDPRGDPGNLCAAAIAAEERRSGLPRHLLTAISLAESGRWDASRKATVAWPWTIMAEGKGQYFPSKQEALAAARAIRARGVRNMDVGCMQINMMYHGDAFADIEEALDPRANVAYAARFLQELYAQMGSWHEAAGRYHSATPQYNQPYKERIARLWDEQRKGGSSIALASRDPAAAAPAEVARDPVPRARTIIPVDYDRMARLASAWRQRTARATPTVVPVAARLDRARPGLRDARAESAFAAKRVRHLEAWREASSRIRAEQQLLAME